MSSHACNFYLTNQFAKSKLARSPPRNDDDKLSQKPHNSAKSLRQIGIRGVRHGHIFDMLLIYQKNKLKDNTPRNYKEKLANTFIDTPAFIYCFSPGIIIIFFMGK